MSTSQRQEFCVRWNSHLGSIGAAFPQLLAGQRFVDVTLVCESHQVHCHRLVLAACSSYFESILAENPCKHPVIILPSEIKLWEIHALVDFMYKGEVNVTQIGLPQLLRCAEQLRIRGLYGSDAALNLHQLQAHSSNLTTAATVASTTVPIIPSSISTVAVGMGSGTNDSTETDDTTTNSTITTTNVASALEQTQQKQQQQQQLHDQALPTHLMALTAAAAAAAAAEQQQTNGITKQQQQQQQQQPQPHMANNSFSTAATQDDSADDSTMSNVYEQQYTDDKYAVAAAIAANAATTAVATSCLTGGAGGVGGIAMHMDSTVEEDHNYVAQHDEDDSSYTGNLADSEINDVSNNSSLLLQNSIDANASFKRVRRSEASLAQAAKCVSKGQTFQTVSNMYNIPVSTIRFYMARKGILPKRKRGRGAATTGAGGAAQANTGLVNAMMSQAIAQIKRSSSPLTDLETAAAAAAAANNYQHAMLLGIKTKSDMTTNLL